MSTDHSHLHGDQHVILYPTFAYFDQMAADWKMPITGFVYQVGRDSIRQRIFFSFMQKLLKIDRHVIDHDQIFEKRIRGFLNEPQKRVSVVFHVGENDQSVTGKSKRTGHIHVAASLDPSELPKEAQDLAHESTDHTGPIRHKLTCRVHLAPDDERQIEHDVNIIPPRGISVISDIDDTLKVSQVAHRQQLLQNTFLEPFSAVPGMASLYKSWEEKGAAFHYVSSSPWQLFEPLNELLKETGFPVGSYHLRSYRFGDPSVFKVFISKKRNKYNIIKSIFRMFPQRRFVLVGDSGEKDAEIYGKVARKFPKQVERILIRRVEGRAWTRYRVAKAFRKVPMGVWQTFRVPTQIQDVDFG